MHIYILLNDTNISNYHRNGYHAKEFESCLCEDRTLAI